MTTLDNIQIILVETSHPGNIGATARVMKNMGLAKLVLVRPKKFPHHEATAMASGASDILTNAKAVDTLQEAIEGCGVVFGTSARRRTFEWPQMSARKCGEFVKKTAPSQPVGLVFGRERSGLTNEELEHCQYHVYIPTNPEFPSLNLASAVQVLCYELYAANIELGEPVESQAFCEVSAKDREGFYEHLAQVLQQIGYYDPNNPKRLMTRLKRLYNRARMDRSELNILRGTLSAIQNKLTQCSKE